MFCGLEPMCDFALRVLQPRVQNALRGFKCTSYVDWTPLYYILSRHLVFNVLCVVCIMFCQPSDQGRTGENTGILTCTICKLLPVTAGKYTSLLLKKQIQRHSEYHKNSYSWTHGYFNTTYFVTTIATIPNGCSWTWMCECYIIASSLSWWIQ